MTGCELTVLFPAYVSEGVGWTDQDMCSLSSISVKVEIEKCMLVSDKNYSNFIAGLQQGYSLGPREQHASLRSMERTRTQLQLGASF